MTTRLSHALVFVRDLDPMAAFYASVFGLEHAPSDAGDATDGTALLRGAGGAELLLHRVPPHVIGEIKQPADWREDTAIKLCFAVDDLDATRQALLSAGGQAKEPWAWRGADYCDCCDPEGNVIQLVARRANMP